jgi:hypothetical protein
LILLGKSKTFRPRDVDQPQLAPPSILALAPKGQVFHVVRNLVREELDLSAILAEYWELRGVSAVRADDDDGALALPLQPGGLFLPYLTPIS